MDDQLADEALIISVSPNRATVLILVAETAMNTGGTDEDTIIA